MLVGNLNSAHLNRHLPRQANGTRGSNGCLICDDVQLNCECSFGQVCAAIGRTCDTCSYAACIAGDTPSTSKKKGGVSGGAVAGAVIGVIILLAATVAAYFWYRRRQRLAAQNAASKESKPDVPARAEEVLNRPDPNEKPSSPPPQLSSIRFFAGSAQGTINLDPAASTPSRSHLTRSSVQSNPFEDNHSIRTTSTGTQSNVIPIALVPPGSVEGTSSTQSSERSAAQSHGNLRGEMNLDHVNISNDALPPPGAAYMASGRTVGDNTNNRMSYMTTGSYTSDFLETSVIVTPTRGTVKQVVGVAKAEVLRTPPSESLSRASTLSRQARSPLANSSFGPADVMREEKEEQEVTAQANPFSDSQSPYSASSGSPTPSATTFGITDHYNRSQGTASWLKEDPSQLYNDERPASVYTQASAIVADISNARRVHLGFEHATQLPQTPLSAAFASPRTPYRMTSAKLVSPTVMTSAALQTGSSSTGAFEQQQARALKDLKRTSISSMMTTATGADSILESFPFVPPSPISNLPPRTPPRSPVNQQSFSGTQDDRNAQSAQELINRARASASASASSSSSLPPLQPPNRKVLGMSVASNGSTASNGLGSFPFQIDSGTTETSNVSTAPSSFSTSSGGSVGQRKRASLDTLALTSDLSSYPLGFDKSAVPPVPRR